MMTPFYPAVLPRSTVHTLWIGGDPVEVLHTDVADFAIIALNATDQPPVVEVRRADGRSIDRAVLHPVSRGVDIAIDGGAARFQPPAPGGYSLEMGTGKPLYVFFKRSETGGTARDGERTLHIQAGQVADASQLDLSQIDTLCLAHGAVLRGPLHVRNRDGFTICGHGIIEGDPHGRRHPLVVLEACSNVVVEGVTLIRPPAWMLVPAKCDGVSVRDVSFIGEVVSSDGIDVLGSSRVVIEDCFIHANDDCVAVKAFQLGARNVEDLEIDARKDVKDVLVRRCVLANWNAGNAMEIGHELAVDRIEDIVFSDIDVLHVHDKGAVFAIHCYDHAHVRSVVFENIRIEHCYDKLIDFRVSFSGYSSDDTRGRISDVVLRDIDWTSTPFNAGYTISVIGGWAPENPVERVSIQRFRINGRAIQSIEELEIHTRHCKDLLLKP